MVNVSPDQRGVVSGLLNLVRNLGLITGAGCMEMLFALGAGTSNITTASPEAVAAAMRGTFGAAALLIGVGFVVVVRHRGDARSIP